MPITFDRGVCCDLNETIAREWLVTNGLGGYAAGTIAGILTRRQHGLLITLPPDTTTAQLLLAKIDEEVVFDQRTYNLGTNEYRDGTLSPSGFVHLEAFRLEHGFPIFTYRLGGINGMMLEKRIWLPQGHNTTYIQYRLLRTTNTESSGHRRSGITGALSNSNEHKTDHVETTQRSLTITLLPFAASRPYNQLQCGDKKQHFHVRSIRHEDNIDDDNWDATLLPPGVAGCTVQARSDTSPFHIIAVGHPESQTAFIPTGVWYWNFLHRHDRVAGYPVTDDFYLPGVIRTTLWPDEDATLTIIASTEALSSQILRPHQLNLLYKRSVERQKRLSQRAPYAQRFFGEGGEAAHPDDAHVLPLTITSDPYAGGKEYLDHLLQAADRFIIRRKLSQSWSDVFFNKPESSSVLLTSYYEMENKTRNILITLPGLTLVTGHHDDALRILRELMHHFKDGLLPDRLPLPGQPLQESDYGSVDTTLWYFYALDYYLRVTHNYHYLEEFYQHLAKCIYHYVQGTPAGICVDPSDGLLKAQRPDKALTWMDATSNNGKAITPRPGKPVEVNALWYNALSLMLEWSQYLHHISAYYQELQVRCKHSFQQRFWYAQGGYLYDVIDGPNGNDAALRPNQLLALSLRHPVLDEGHRQSVFDMVTQHLLTPLGLRTLTPQSPAYHGRLGQQHNEQQQALHQGATWTWLLGPYIDAMLNIQAQAGRKTATNGAYLFQEYLWRKGLLLLEPFQKRFSEGIVGMSAEVFDGDPPHNTEQNNASALSTGELLRIYDILARMRVAHTDYVLSR